MDKEKEKRIVSIICDMSEKLDYSKPEDVDTALSKALGSETFGQSVFGKKYIDRLNSIKRKENGNTCILCGMEAFNNVICTACIRKVGNINPVKSKSQSSSKKEYADNNIKIEDLLKDMGDDMMQLATENSVRALKKLTWVSVGLLIINSIIIIFMMIFLWKFMMAQ